MILRSKILVLLLLIASVTFSQKIGGGSTKSIDSVRNVLKNATDDTVRVNCLSYLSEYPANSDEWLSINEDLKSISEKNIHLKLSKRLHDHYMKCLSNALGNIGGYYLENGNFDKAMASFKEGLTLTRKMKDTSAMSNMILNMGGIYYYTGNIPKTLELWNEAFRLQEACGDVKSAANTLNNLGAIYRNQGNLPEAIDSWTRSLKMMEQVKELSGQATILNNLGAVIADLGDENKSLEYMYKAVKIREQINDPRGMSVQLNNIGKSLVRLNQIEKGIETIEKALETSKKIQDKGLMADCYVNLGGAFTRLKQDEKVMEYYLEGNRIYSEIGNSEGLTTTWSFLADLYLKKGDIKRSMECGTSSMAAAKKLGFPGYISSAASVLTKVYKKLNKPAQALEMMELWMTMRDSANNKEARKLSIKKQFQYEYARKTAEDSVKIAEEKKITNIQLDAQKTQIRQDRLLRFVLYGGLALVIIFAGFMFNRFKVTQKQKKLIEDKERETERQKNIIEAKQKEIVDSIYYAKRIQSALAPSERFFDKTLEKLMKEKGKGD